MHGDDVEIGNPRHGDLLTIVERHRARPDAPFRRAVLPGMVNQQAAHDGRGHPEELLAVLPHDPALPDQSQVRFVDERCRPERMIAALACQVSGRLPAKLLIDHGQQLVARFAVAGGPGPKQHGQVLRR